MNRALTWGAVFGAIGFLILVYLMTSSVVKEAHTGLIETTNTDAKVVDERLLNQSASGKVVDRQLIARADNSKIGQNAKSVSKVLDASQFEIKVPVVGASKAIMKTALNVDEIALNGASNEIIDAVNDRWFNINDGHLNRHTHWHKADGSDLTYKNFTESLHFFNSDEKFSNATAVCNNQKSYSEILLLSDGKKWLDLNQGGAHPYSVTLWEWYDTVAIKSGNETFMKHKTPKRQRWNTVIPQTLMREILRTGQFEIFVEGNPYRSSESGGVMLNKAEKLAKPTSPNLNLKANVSIHNIEDVRGCFNVVKPSRSDKVQSAKVKSDVLELSTYFEGY